jgi:hypothetical protein
MANLGIALGGMAQARESRLGRELQDRALGLQERQLQFDQQAQQTKMVEENLSQLTELAAEAKVAGALPVVDLMRNRVAETAQAAGMDPTARVAMFDAAMEGALTPEQEAANKARGEVAGAEVIAAETGVDPNEVLQARGFLPASPEKFRTLSDEEKIALDLPPETVVQVSDETGEIKVVQGEKSVKLRTAIDTSTGQPVFVTEDMIMANPAGYMPQPTGMKFVSDGQGGFVLATGGQSADAADLTTSTKTGLEKAEINVRNMLSRIDNIDAAYDPEFLEFGSRAESFWLGLKEKAGFGLTEEEKKFQERYTVFATRTIDNINMRLNELSGAAVSPAEAERLRASLPDAESDSPTQFMAKVKDIKKRLKLEAMKLSYARQRGLNALTDINLEDFEAIVQQRGRQIEQQIRMENPQAPDREVATMVQTAIVEEFSR